MNIIILDEDNIEEYKEYINPDIAENIGRPFFRGIIVHEEDDPVAGMIWEVKNSMQDAEKVSNIHWLRIDKCRNEEGVVKALFDNYVSMIREDEVIRSDYSLSARMSEVEKKVLEENGFTVKLMEGDVIKARLSEISELQFFKNAKISDIVQPLRNMTQRGFNAAARQFHAAGHYGICEDLPYLPRSYFENDISCYVEENDEVEGMFLFHLNPSGGLVIVLMAVIGGDYKKILPLMIKKSMTSMTDYYSPDTEIWIDRHDYASLAISEKLFPRGFGVPVYIGSRDENY